MWISKEKLNDLINSKTYHYKDEINQLSDSIQRIKFELENPRKYKVNKVTKLGKWISSIVNIRTVYFSNCSRHTRVIEWVYKFRKDNVETIITENESII